MKIIGSELKEKLDIFNSSHRVDSNCEYYYGMIEDQTPVEEKKKYLVSNNLGHCRSVVIDGVHHFWKPIGEEVLVKKEYYSKSDEKVKVEKVKSVDNQVKRGRGRPKKIV